MIYESLSPDEHQSLWSDLIECVNSIHTNHVEICRFETGWIVQDFGQRIIADGKWLDKKEACRNNQKYEPDIFSSVTQAWKKIRELSKV